MGADEDGKNDRDQENGMKKNEKQIDMKADKMVFSLSELIRKLQEIQGKIDTDPDVMIVIGKKEELPRRIQYMPETDELYEMVAIS